MTAANPLYRIDGLPPFDRITASDVEPGIRTLIAETRAELERLEADPAARWDALVGQLDEMGRTLWTAWSAVRHLTAVMNTPELRAAHEAVQEEIVEVGLRIGQSRPIYDALVALQTSPEWGALDATQRRIVELRVLQAELNGVGLDGEARARFNAIAAELNRLATEFSNHLLDATRAWERVITEASEIAGLTADERGMLAASYQQAYPDAAGGDADTGPWRVTLDFPPLRAVLDHAHSRELRETVFKTFSSRASSGELDNTPFVGRILALRKEQAALLGFRNWAELAMESKMADVESASSLMQTLLDTSYPRARGEIDALREFAAAEGLRGELLPWDYRYYRDRLRERQFGFSSEELRPYFPLPRVLAGLFGVVERLFGVTIEPADGDAPVWHPDVRFFRILEDGAPIAAFYLDPYSRPETKRGGAWMDECLDRRRVQGELQLPVAHAVCNGTPPVGDRPSLMAFDEVETLFHEFGHALQHMLTRIERPSVAGIQGVEWDAVELASQFMENWCYHRPTVRGMTAHVDTGEPLPDELFDKLVAARTFFSGSDFIRQLRFGLLDMALHTTFDPDRDDLLALQREVSARTTVIAPWEGDRMLCAFAHIFAGGYSAGYYSYKWAEVLSADAFAAFEEAGLDDDAKVAAVGRRFRETVLGLGGSRHPVEVYRAFRGRDATPDALLRHNALAG